MSHHHNTNLYLLLLSSLAASSQCTAINTIQERAIIPFRAPEIPPPRPILPSPERPGLLGGGGGGGGIRPGGSVLGDGSSAAEAGTWSAAAAGRGTAPESTTPFLSKTNNEGGNRELVEKAVEAVGDVFDLLQNVVSLFGDSGDDGDGDEDDDGDDTKWRASTTSSILPQAVKPTQVANTSDSAATANYMILSTQSNETYTFLSDPRLMSKDIVAEMANTSSSSASPRLKPNQDLFTPSEYKMFLDDPICFYANIESMYLDAFSSSTMRVAAASASESESPTSTTPSTNSPQRRQSLADEEEEEEEEATTCPNPHDPTNPCPPTRGSPQWTSSSSQASAISSLWATELPDQLWSAHFATPSAASGDNDVTATATSMTSCAGLEGGDGPVTKYRELKIRGADAEKTPGRDGAATGMANRVEGAGTRTVGKYWLVGGVAGVIFLVI